MNSEEFIKYNNELTELYKWFFYYDNQINQYNRCLRLNIQFDKDISDLDQQAEKNSKRINELKKLIDSLL